MKKKNQIKMKGALLFLLSFLMIAGFYNCSDDDNMGIVPPDPNLRTTLTTFFPDSGGMATKMILCGRNFGTDTSLVKVTVNGKRATLIGMSDTCVYAIVPIRADTGYVELHLGKGEDVKTLTYPNKFKYQFFRNVTTYLGKADDPNITAGDVNTARLRRPIDVKFDKEGNMYINNEGRGFNANGGLCIFNAHDQNMSLVMSNTGYFYQVLNMDFSLSEDTLYIANFVGELRDVKGRLGVGILPRDAGFYKLDTLVMSEPVTCVRVNPKSGEMFYATNEDNFHNAYVYKYNAQTRKRELQFKIEGKDLSGGGDVNDQQISDICFTKDGAMAYILCRKIQMIYKAYYNFSTGKFGDPIFLCGSYDKAEYVDGFGAEVRIDQPIHGDVDEEGNLYFADRWNHCIRKATPDGYVSTYAGQGRGHEGYKDGEPAEAQFRYPEGCAFGPDGALYVADRDNHVIRRIVVE